MLQIEQQLSKNQRIIDALSQIWRRQWLALEEQRAGVLIGRNPEYLHRLRVTLRQTRALLKVFADGLPCHEAHHFTIEFKWLAVATSAMRDLDVQLADILSWSAKQDAYSGDALGAVIAQLSREREIAHKRLRRILASKRYMLLAQRWLDFLSVLPDLPKLPKEAGFPARALVALKLAKQCLRLLKGGFAVQPMSVSRDLHELRIHAKRVRYIVDSFAPLLEGRKRSRHLTKALRLLQQALGDYRDSDLASMLAARLLKDARSTAVRSLLTAWRGDLELRKRSSRDRYKAAFVAFGNACRDLPR